MVANVLCRTSFQKSQFMKEEKSQPNEGQAV